MAAHMGHRLRKGATTGVVMAAAVAALAASQAPEMLQPPADNAGGDRTIGAGDTASSSKGPGGGSATGNSPYYTELPPLNTPNKPGASPHLPVTPGPAEAGIPASVYSAYKRAELSIRSTDPHCNLSWQMLAGIGKVESGQANGGRVDANGTASPRILGPALDGKGFALITDTDGGAYDGDTKLDRAVGPMQFIPSTWATWGQDANSDGKKDPNNIYDAAQAAGLYLCANDRDLALKSDLDRAILSYNHSTEYLNLVMSWVTFYERGTHQVPDGTGVLPVHRSDNGGRSKGNQGSGNRGNGSHPTTPPSTAPAPKPGTPTPKPSETRPGTVKPPTVPTKPPVTPPALPAAAKVSRLAIVANEKLTTTTGSAFTGAPRVAALDAAGKPVAGVSIRFEITGTTDTRFAGGGTTATVTTGSTGLATAPGLRAGEKTGSFTVRATVVRRTLAPADFTATVTERQADTLTRVAGDPLSAATGTSFSQQLQVKATDKGALAPGVLVTAVIVTSKTDPKESTEGPSFKSAAGTPVRTVTLKTGTNGLLTFASGDLLAGDEAGTFYLQLTAPGGGTTFIDLTVTAPATSTPEPTPDPTPSGSGTPEATPSPSTSPSA
ncbi:lytic transglycosylase domain-containing protein [Streptomyces sp. NPDC004284]|uniref:lytic transglycosylase domain-containing protein n=1 Tax=Streptomyces sp. NPDC004284 TaxID=3364695 RepID=UPI0036CBE7F3